MNSDFEIFAEVGCITPSNSDNSCDVAIGKKVIMQLIENINAVYGDKKENISESVRIGYDEGLLPIERKPVAIANAALGIIKSNGFGVNICPICEKISRANPHVYVFCRTYWAYFVADYLFLNGELISSNSTDYPDLCETMLHQIVNPIRT